MDRCVLEIVIEKTVVVCFAKGDRGPVVRESIFEYLRTRTGPNRFNFVFAKSRPENLLFGFAVARWPRPLTTTTGTHCYGYLCTHHGGNLVWTRPYGALVRWGCDATGAQWVAGTDREQTRVQCRGRKTARRVCPSVSVRPSAVAEVNRELGERPRAHVLGNIPWVFTRPKRWR